MLDNRYLRARRFLVATLDRFLTHAVLQYKIWTSRRRVEPRALIHKTLCT
jgi:hypothetical protein